MKTLVVSLILFTIPLIIPSNLFAQDGKTETFWVHEDPVIPAKVLDYEAYCATLADKCAEFNIQKANWFTISTDELRYFHITPIDKMGDLDQNRFSLLRNKMGEQEFNQLFDNFDSCYETHNDYIIHLDHNLSYMPSGVEIMQDGMEFRKLELWYVTPKNIQKMLDIAKRFKELYSRKSSPEHYRVYRSGFGAPEPFILVAISAPSAEEYERIRKLNKELLGKERDVIYKELLETISKVETLSGYMRTDLSYSPKK
ncbi:hypothetical protein [Constantimarinum furrinae]|uniref:Uncharacterized protein n=1 Tax=Constantimarinum furrinae TaxID=2562285 RepID=A0A7G8PUS7_9FLAO|nr:hypothetical protein [Constantimarinum furrinae]QNJ98093.1 hypothetical protein ALE3EI_1535 [Constantimarinum furrinae]